MNTFWLSLSKFYPNNFFIFFQKIFSQNFFLKKKFENFFQKIFEKKYFEKIFQKKFFFKKNILFNGSLISSEKSNVCSNTTKNVFDFGDVARLLNTFELLQTCDFSEVVNCVFIDSYKRLTSPKSLRKISFEPSFNSFFFEKKSYSLFLLKKINFLFFIFLLAFASCQQKSNLSETEKKELPPDFVAFYNKFHSDSLFQIKHIQFPLPGFPSQVDSIAGNFQWTKENWRMHRAENFKDSLFTRTFEMPVTNCVNESVLIKSTSIGTFRRFYKRDNDWFLIFYSDMNRIQ